MKRLLTLAACASLAGAAAIAETAPADVVFDDYGAVAEPLTDAGGTAATGAEVFADKKQGNCISCHLVSSLDAPWPGEVGPVLDGVADRWEEAQLRGIIANAKHTFPDTIMPAMYKSEGFIRPGAGFTNKPAEEPLPPILSAQQIEDLVAFLGTLKEAQ